MIPVATATAAFVGNRVATMTSASIPSFRESSMAVYDLVHKITIDSNMNTVMLQRLKSMDLDARVQVIDALLRDLDDKMLVKYVSVTKARGLLADTMRGLEQELGEFNRWHDCYRESWFPSWRYGAHLESQLNIVSVLSDRLSLRLELLTQLLPLLSI
mgnify:CR=1 FL=1|jgi:hypothetical protein|tara:strand:- start:1712 stop:2185 length:474 start_codon:yes stop_codon:yes gene_type:complete